MSFLSKKNANANIERNRQSNKLHFQRKESGSFIAHHFHVVFHSGIERASAFTSKYKKRGTITLEAALAVSFFFFGMLCLSYLLEMMVIETTVRNALHAVAKEVAVEIVTNPVIPIRRMEQSLVEQIGTERLERSMIVNGSSGIDCSHSKKYGNTTILDLSASYRIEIPVLMFRIPAISREERIRVKGWTGQERRGAASLEEEMVYVTAHGMVYHKDIHCTYLDLSVKAVDKEEVESLRNQSGGTYKACASCKQTLTKAQKVYITDYGDRYHGSLECSGLKRNIYAVPLSDLHGIGGCSKCVK